MPAGDGCRTAARADDPTGGEGRAASGKAGLSPGLLHPPGPAHYAGGTKRSWAAGHDEKPSFTFRTLDMQSSALGCLLAAIVCSSLMAGCASPKVPELSADSQMRLAETA